MKQLILASQSPRRRELLSRLGLPFGVISASVDERRRAEETPEEYVRRLSQEKAQTAAVLVEGPTLVLAADTIVVDGGETLGKPGNTDEAAEMLRRLRGRTHYVTTAVTLLDSLAKRMITQDLTSPVTMRNYTDAEIAAYVASGDPLDKAGAYAIQHKGFHPVAGFDHCVTNVMGLPLCEVIRLLRDFEARLPDRALSRAWPYLSQGCPTCRALLEEGMV